MNWHQVEAIKTRAVERGLARRDEATIPNIGIDEKQFRLGQNYISSLVDIEGGRVLEVVEERTEKSCKMLIEKALTEPQQEQVTAVALDMWKAYANAVEEILPEAVMVHDRFHVSQHLNKAVNKVRCEESKQLLLQGDECFKGSKYFWCSNEENVKESLNEDFGYLRNADLKIARACAIKEYFRHFWIYT